MPSRNNRRLQSSPLISAANTAAKALARAELASEAVSGITERLGKLKASAKRHYNAVMGPKPSGRVYQPRARNASVPRALAAAPVSIPAVAGASYFSEVNRGSDRVRITGASTFGVISAIDGTTGNCVIPFSLHPISFMDRMATMASTYDKYVYHNIRAVYTPLCPTSFRGAVAMYFDRDVADPPAAAANVKAIMSMEGATLGSVWSKSSTSVRRDSSEKRTYSTNPATIDPKEVDQFKLYVYLLGITTGSTFGYVTVHYDIELISPVLAPNEVSQVSGLSVPPSVYSYSGGNAYFNAGSATISALPFGLGTVARTGNIVELVLSDTLGSTTSAGFTIGNGGTAFTSLNAGQTLYLIQPPQAAESANTWLMYLSYEDAVRASPRYIFNTGVVGNLFSGTVGCYQRQIGGGIQGNLIVS